LQLIGPPDAIFPGNWVLAHSEAELGPVLAEPCSILEGHMLKWALFFLVISIIAGLFGFTGISAAAAGIAKILFFIFIVIFVVLLILGLMVGSALF
jgi:uncharacterized membrane protein YtjA (UPF0391 family)